MDKNNEETVIGIDELIEDDRNFNKGTEEGRELMEKSFAELGAGRSVLVDKNNRLIAGNKSKKAAEYAGIKKVRVIETTGDELIAVKRVDMDLDSEKGRKMALADNATQQMNLAWDEEQIFDISEQYGGFDPSDWGIDIKNDIAQDGPNYNEYVEKHKNEWFLNILLSSENECQSLYEELSERGMKCKIIH